MFVKKWDLGRILLMSSELPQNLGGLWFLHLSSMTDKGIFLIFKVNFDCLCHMYKVLNEAQTIKIYLED